MQRSLYSGVTGLNNHQLILDTAANNLANISTNGFKSSRVSFSTALLQTQNAGSSPSSTAGGVNPRQVGLGVRNSSVDVDMRQGALVSTGRTLDLAIQGEGFFAVAGSNGSTSYTRVGNFGQDSLSNVVDLGSGMFVQGRKLDSTGNATGNRTNINLADSQSIDAKATSNITFQGNLSSTTPAIAGSTLSSVLPLTVTSTGAAAVDGTLLKDITAFTGAAIEPTVAGLSASGTNVAISTTPVSLATTTLTTPGYPQGTFTLPAQDLSTFGPITLKITTNAGATTLGSITIPAADYSAASAAARTFKVSSYPNLAGITSPVDITIEAATGGTLTSTALTTTDSTKQISVFGTKPDGTAYAGTFAVNPWQDTVLDLTTKINAALVQGSETFGTVKIENGTLTATGSGDQTGFSMFLGEKDPLGPSTAATPASVASGSSAIYTAGTTQTMATGSVAAGEAGLLNPVFTSTTSPASNINIKVKVTSGGTTKEVGSITIPAGSAVGSQFSLSSLPHINTGDTVSYEVGSTASLAAGAVTFTSSNVLDSSASNLLRDAYDGTNAVADGRPDLFQENSATDVNAYVYDKATNGTLDWYKLRFVPDKVTSSVQVYDSVGGAHTVEATFFRTGTRSTTTGSQTSIINSWDMILNVAPSEGKFKDPLVVGIEFDDKGRYVGNGRLGSTAHGNTLSDPNQYQGTPSDNTIQVAWGSTGDATIALNLGNSAATNGLTGFGSASTATAVGQDGYASGSLDSLSVTNAGELVGLYTNGKSLKLYQFEIDTFRNPAGLTSAGSNLWQVSANSGDPLARTAGQGGAGSITSGALEGSNVDIASEFTRLITAQRGFQVNSRVIQTTDSILQELAGLIRG